VTFGRISLFFFVASQKLTKLSCQDLSSIMKSVQDIAKSCHVESGDVESSHAESDDADSM
jgi:hypothetical protein